MDLKIIMLCNVMYMEFQLNSQIPFDFTDKFASFGIQVKWLKDL